MSQIPPTCRLVPVAFLLALGVTSAASAVDLTVSSVEVIQAVQYGTTKLFGGNVTWVRVKVGTGGVAVSGVDASLRLTIDGVPQPLPPVFSINGPITAPITPDSNNINDTINFAVVPPVSNSVMFTIEVNPNRNVVETNYANNTLSVTKVIECRKIMELAYVPIIYLGTPPAANLMEPGIGDGFLRGIYHTGEWNYHKTPTPDLIWNQDINSSNNVLLNTLNDIRLNQIPALGYARPDMIYGWLPGNPYSGNGQAGGIPSDRAFGNTDTTRHQRTFAHEIGHCFGRSHINQTINTVGVDVENQLKDTQNIPQIMPATKNDIMVAGLLTNQAWVWQGTYDAVHLDSRMQCTPFAPPPAEVPVLRVSGVIDNATRAVALDPVTRIQQAPPTVNDPNGDTTVIALNAAGQELARVTVRTDSNRELCGELVGGKPVLDPRSALYALMPQTIDGQAIHAIQVQDRASGRITAARSRSANGPQAAITKATLLPAGDGAPPRVRVEWRGTDADGDALTYNLLYSPDNGASWLPLVVNTTSPSFEFDLDDVPAATAGARLRLIATDGLNISESEMTPQGWFPEDGDGINPPATFLISPNNGTTFPQKAPIAFHGTSWDLEDRMLSGGQITWTSSIDGPIGTGLLFINSNLSPGTHTITVTGTDNSGFSGSKSISITISPRTVISPDCNNNGVLDSIDIANGTSPDVNGNGIPDECETLCAADITGDGQVNVNDLLAVINAWGSCPGPCPPYCAADVNHDCSVSVNDLLAVINAWGPCP